MTKTAFPQIRFPELKLPKIDLDAVIAVQKQNLATVQEAQNVLVDATQAVVRLQRGYAEETVAGAQSALKAREPKKPQVAIEEFKAAAEKAVAVTKQGVDITVAAQRRVVELFTQRAQANVDALKALAA